MSSILNIGVTKDLKRKLVIESINKKEVNVPNRDKAEKIVFKTKEPTTGKKFNISDAWIRDGKDSTRIAGLWFSLVDGGINQNSTLAKVLKYYGAEVLGDLVGEQITAWPDDNNFLVVLGCDL